MVSLTFCSHMGNKAIKQQKNKKQKKKPTEHGVLQQFPFNERCGTTVELRVQWVTHVG